MCRSFAELPNTNWISGLKPRKKSIFWEEKLLSMAHWKKVSFKQIEICVGFLISIQLLKMKFCKKDLNGNKTINE